MSDLIDLNSPDINKLLRKDLASPLIPPPSGLVKTDPVAVTNGLPILIADEKRSSSDNNPFDKVFEETAEYVRNKEDPFEIVLEKNASSKKSKRHSVIFKDDFTPKHTKHAEVLKLNKTLDDSVLNFDSNNLRAGLIENSIRDLNNTDLLKENNSIGDIPQIIIHPIHALNSSILNNSSMNDSLTEADFNVQESAIRSLVARRVSMCIQKGIMEAEGTLNNNQLTVLNSKRSYSTNDEISPKNFNCKQRSRSLLDTKRKSSRSSRSTLPSLASFEYDDQMNKAFLQEQSTLDNSVFSDISNISEITRLNSLSSAYNSSLSFGSNGTMNKAFVKSGSSSSSYSQNLPKFSPPNTRDSLRSNVTSSTSTAETVRNDIDDLRQKFEALKTKLGHNSSSDVDNVKTDVSEFSEKSTESKLEIEENSDKKEEKLIDVEVFVPSDESKSFKSKDSFSDSSTDSVFIKGAMDKSILNEARRIAKNFEEMANDKLNSSGLDLLSNHTQFDFDCLPESDDEVVNNLIDLPPSPAKTEVPPNSPKEIENENSDPGETRQEINKVKEIEIEFTQPEDPEKKIVATTLLLELEKVVKNEKNPDAEKLLSELEKVLGLQLENNTDLLRTYLQNAKSNVQSDKEDIGDKEIENNTESKLIENEGNVHNVKDKESEENASDQVQAKDILKRKASFVIRKGRSDFMKSVSKSLDTPLKVKTPIRKSVPEELSSKMAIKNNLQSKEHITAVRKRFSSDPNDLNTSLGKKLTYSPMPSMKKTIPSKEVRDKITPAPEVQKSTLPNMANAMRNKLKNKSETGISRKGPMKATVPLGNMQKGSSGRKVSSVSEHETSMKVSPETPPRFNAPTSTPNTSVSSLFKKSKTKPVASSTPDNRRQETPKKKPQTPFNRKLSCNISPVSAHARSSIKQSPIVNKMDVSPKRASTPKARKPPRTPTGIPKFSPMLQRRKSFNDLNKSVKSSESSQLSDSSNVQKIVNSAKKRSSMLPKSPLKNSNMMDLKVKPVSLMSKLQRRVEEKENLS